MSSPSARTVLIRADGGRRIGRGHVVRQISLARRLVEQGAEVRFVSRADPDLQVIAAGFDCVGLGLPEPDPRNRPWAQEDQQSDADATLERAGGPVDVVVVDHYGLDRTWEERVRSIAGRIVAVDDLADRHRDVDVIVDHNWYGVGTASRHEGRVPPAAEQYVGPSYALLQAEYCDYRLSRKSPVWPPQRIVVSFGGTDPGGETVRVLEALSGSEVTAGVDVVVGNPAAVTADLQRLVAAVAGCQLHVAVASLAPILASADLAFGASGAATWERMSLDVPAVVTTTAPHQSGATRALDESGYTHWAGLTGSVSTGDYRVLLAGMLAAGPRRPPALVDGYGAARVAGLICPERAPSLSAAPATALDAPVHIAGSDDPARWRSAAQLFEADLADPAVQRLTVSQSGVPMGWVRAALDGGDVSVTYGVDPAAGDVDADLAAICASDRWQRRTGTADVHRLGWRGVDGR